MFDISEMKLYNHYIYIKFIWRFLFLKIYEWFDTWLKTYKLNTVSVHTYENYEYGIKLIKSHLNDMKLEEVSELYVVNLLQSLLIAEYSKSTIRIVKKTLSQGFRKAVRLGLVNYNPAEDVKIPISAKTKIVNALSIHEQTIIEQAAADDFLGDIIIFLLQTGLRREEVLNLKWENYNKKGEFIKVTKSKTKAGIREIPLSGKAWVIISRQPHINKFVFNNSKGNPMTDSSIRKLYKRLQRVTGITNFTTHVCRHSFVTRLVENGADYKTIAEIVGHTSVAFLMQRYCTISINQKRKDISTLNYN